MSSKAYPRVMPHSWTVGSSRPGITNCDGCGKRFSSSDSLCVIETQVNWFRGDDEVQAFCESCAASRGYTKSPQSLKRWRNIASNLRRSIANHERNLTECRKQLDALEAKIAAAVTNQTQQEKPDDNAGN